MLTNEQKQFIDDNRSSEEFFIVFNYMKGYCVGTFLKFLLLAIENADSDNIEKLKTEFKDYVIIRKWFNSTNVYLVEQYMKNKGE